MGVEFVVVDGELSADLRCWVNTKKVQQLIGKVGKVIGYHGAGAGVFAVFEESQEGVLIPYCQLGKLESEKVAHSAD